MDICTRISPELSSEVLTLVLNFNSFAEHSSKNFENAPELLTEVYRLSNGGIFLYPLCGEEKVTLRHVNSDDFGVELPALSAAAALSTMFWNLMSWREAERGNRVKSKGFAHMCDCMTEFLYSRKEGGKQIPNVEEVALYLN
jgi:hypothetical protein